MLNKLLNAVTKQLGTRFGSSQHYYVENVEQNLTKPCFTVDLLAPTIRSKSPLLYDRTMPLVVHWFGDSENTIKKDCYAMGEQLVECLEYLPFEGTLIRGEDISYQIVDDVLQMFITYSFETRKDTEIETSIESVDMNVTHA